MILLIGRESALRICECYCGVAMLLGWHSNQDNVSYLDYRKVMGCKNNGIHGQGTYCPNTGSLGMNGGVGSTSIYLCEACSR